MPVPGVWQRALARANLGEADLEAAEEERLVSIENGAVRFRHPLLRSTAYYSPPAAARRRAHAAV